MASPAAPAQMPPYAPPAPPVPVPAMAPAANWPQPHGAQPPGFHSHPTSPPPSQWPPGGPQSSNGPSVGKIVGVVAVLVFVVLGVTAALVVRGVSGLSLVNNLEAGECVENFFDDGNNGEFEEVFFVGTTDCGNPHAYEVIATTDLLWAEGAYPGTEEAYFDGEELCLNRYNDFVGGDFWTSPHDLVTFVPTPDGWEQGDRSVQCLVGYADGFTTITGSLEDAGRRS